MNISIISSYPIIQIGLHSALKNKYSNISLYKSLNEALTSINTDNELLIYTLFKDNISELNKIIDAKQNNPNLKFLVIDFNQSKEIFFRLSKVKIDGYILGKFTKEDLEYALHKLSIGTRFYDRDLIYKIVDSDDILDNSKCKSTVDTPLTKREKEILYQLSHGLSNFEISYNLNISENTVKKHISNIFIKINVKDRTQATIYAYNIGLVSKPTNAYTWC